MQSSMCVCVCGLCACVGWWCVSVGEEGGCKGYKPTPGVIFKGFFENVNISHGNCRFF